MASKISVIAFKFSDFAQNSEELLSNSLSHPSPIVWLIVLFCGFLTSLGPCSLSLLPITVAYLAGFENNLKPFLRSLAFCSGIVSALVLLGSISGLIGKVYGQIPFFIPTFVAILSIIMGLNLLGFVNIPLFVGPDPSLWSKKVPPALSPIAAGLAFGLAASPCTTPVLAVLLAWIAKSGDSILGISLLMAFGIGQVLPLLIAGTAAASIPSLLALRPIGKWVVPISGSFFIVTGSLTLLARWF